MLNGLSLFSGYGGIDYALREYVRPIIYCDIEPYAQAILLSRMHEGSIPFAPIWDDVKTLDGNPFKGLVDIIYGGFPCQDLSVAGKGKGLAGERSGLFREIVRLAQEASPTFIFLENVPAIRTRGCLQVQEALASIGYDTRWTTLSASQVGANHKRERWFLLAKSKRKRCEEGANESQYGTEWRSSDQLSDTGEASRVMADTKGTGARMENRESRGQEWESSTNRTKGVRQEDRSTSYMGTNTSSTSGTDVADSCTEGLQGCQWTGENPRETIKGREVPHGSTSQCSDDSGVHGALPDTNMQRHGRETIATKKEDHEGIRQDNGWAETSPFDSSWWGTEPLVGRVVNGSTIRLDKIEYVGNRLLHKDTQEEIPEEDIAKLFRADRIKACGNGVVPLQVRTAFEYLMGIKQSNIINN